MFELMQAGHRYTYKDGLEIHRPEGTQHFVFIYFRSPAVLKLQESSRPVLHHAILLTPQEPHYYRYTEKPYVDDWIHFQATMAEDFLKDIGFPLNQPFPVSDEHWISDSVKALHDLEKSQSPWQQQLVDAHFIQLFYALRTHQVPTQNHTISQYYSVLAKIRSEFYSHPQGQVAIKDLAQAAGISSSRFHHLYRDFFQTTVLQDVVAGRLNRACYLLENSSLPISEIADRSGYNNEVHFMRQFKKHFSRTPGQYRRSRSGYQGHAANLV